MARYTLEQVSATMYRMSTNGKLAGSVRDFGDGLWCATVKGEVQGAGRSPREAFHNFMDGLRDRNAVKAGFANWREWVNAHNKRVREDNDLFMEVVMPALRAAGFNSLKEFLSGK